MFDDEVEDFYCEPEGTGQPLMLWGNFVDMLKALADGSWVAVAYDHNRTHGMLLEYTFCTGVNEAKDYASGEYVEFGIPTIAGYLSEEVLAYVPAQAWKRCARGPFADVNDALVAIERAASFRYDI